jgi:hypothetical protein
VRRQPTAGLALGDLATVIRDSLNSIGEELANPQIARLVRWARSVPGRRQAPVEEPMTFLAHASACGLCDLLGRTEWLYLHRSAGLDSQMHAPCEDLLVVPLVLQRQL